jgi:hypothetical protein
MSGETAGQQAYEAFYAGTECGLPVPWAVLTDWREYWEAAANAVETEKVRAALAQRDAANQDRDKFRKAMLDLAAELERLSAEHMRNADRYDDDAAKEYFHRGCSAALRNSAGRIRHGLGL